MYSAIKTIWVASSGAGGTAPVTWSFLRLCSQLQAETGYSRGEWCLGRRSSGKPWFWHRALEISGHYHVVKLLGQAELMELLLIHALCDTLWWSLPVLVVLAVWATRAGSSFLWCYLLYGYLPWQSGQISISKFRMLSTVNGSQITLAYSVIGRTSVL